jgi:2-oxoglutarate dehydrogenase E2 component (dihydrolipoamide succinyltransferase)
MSTILEIKVPTVGESITEVTIGAWNKKSGDFVNKDEVLCEIESDKATFELPAEASGILEIIAEKGKVVAIGTVICKIQVTEGVSQQSAQKNEKNKDEKQPEQKNQTVQNDTDDIKKYPSPAADKILSEKGIDSKEVDGTGKDGRITKEDALKAEKKSGSIKLATDSREDRREKMTSLRKTIAKRLVAAKNETAMLTTFNEVDMKPIMDIRAKYKDKFKEKYEINLGFMSFFVKACCAALQEFPAVNAYIDGDELVYHNYCDISVAVGG